MRVSDPFGFVRAIDMEKLDKASAENKKRVLNMLEDKDQARKQRIKEIKAMKLPDWERKLMLKATKSATWGW